METEFESEIWREKKLEEVLLSDSDPVTKVKQITGLGFDEDDAEEVVRRYQVGQKMPVYYEQLEFSDDDELELE